MRLAIFFKKKNKTRFPEFRGAFFEKKVSGFIRRADFCIRERQRFEEGVASLCMKVLLSFSESGPSMCCITVARLQT